MGRIAVTFTFDFPDDETIGKNVFLSKNQNKIIGHATGAILKGEACVWNPREGTVTSVNDPGEPKGPDREI